MTPAELRAHPDYCHACDRLESVPPGVKPYVFCLECGHVYWTPEELLARYNQKCDEMDARADDDFPAMDPEHRFMRVEDIYFCQECTHDF